MPVNSGSQKTVQSLHDGGNSVSQPDAPFSSLYVAPYITVQALLNAGCAKGVLQCGRSLIPCKPLPARGIAIGGYLHSELCSIAAGEATPAALQQLLKAASFPYLFAEGLKEEKNYRNLSTALRSCGWITRELPGRQSPYIDFPIREHGADLYAFLHQKNPKEYRNLRAARRKLEASYQVSVQFIEAPLTNGLATRLADIEARSSKREVGIFSRTRKNKTMALLRGIPVRVALLLVDGAPVAWDLDIERDGTVYSYNRSYDRAYAAFGPGKLLHYENLNRACAGGARRAELLGDADALKLRLATGVRQRERLAAFRPGILGTAAHAMFRIRQLLKKKRS